MASYMYFCIEWMQPYCKRHPSSEPYSVPLIMALISRIGLLFYPGLDDPPRDRCSRCSRLSVYMINYMYTTKDSVLSVYG